MGHNCHRAPNGGRRGGKIRLPNAGSQSLQGDSIGNYGKKESITLHRLAPSAWLSMTESNRQQVPVMVGQPSRLGAAECRESRTVISGFRILMS